MRDFNFQELLIQYVFAQLFCSNFFYNDDLQKLSKQMHKMQYVDHFLTNENAEIVNFFVLCSLVLSNFIVFFYFKTIKHKSEYYYIFKELN